jgi:hypothetical protein
LDVIDKLRQQGENVMHVRYEAMISNPERFSQILTSFLPELGTLDPEVNGIAEGADDRRSQSVANYIKSHQVQQNTCARFPITWVSQMSRLGYYDLFQ